MTISNNFYRLLCLVCNDVHSFTILEIFFFPSFPCFICNDTFSNIHTRFLSSLSLSLWKYLSLHYFFLLLVIWPWVCVKHGVKNVQKRGRDNLKPVWVRNQERERERERVVSKRKTTQEKEEALFKDHLQGEKLLLFPSLPHSFSFPILSLSLSFPLTHFSLLTQPPSHPSFQH